MSHQIPPVAVIMAAGKSTRMKSKIPKVLHKVAGRCVVDFIVQAAREGCGVQDCIAIVGHEAERVQEHMQGQWGEGVRFAVQEPQHGTGHAVMQAEPLLRSFHGDVLTLAGDTPLVSAEVLHTLVEHHRKTGATATVLTAELDDPGMYGRVVRGPGGRVSYIVEARDASAEELGVREINTSIYCFRAEPLFRTLSEIRPDNAQGEYYLTDVIALLARRGEPVEAVVSPEPSIVMGVNTRSELAQAGALLCARKLDQLMADGVTVIDPNNTYVDTEVAVGPDTILYPGVILEGATTIGSDCVIGPHAHLVDTRLGDGVTFNQSRSTLAEVGDGVRIGPFAHLRPGTIVHADARIGSFVELKKAELGEAASIAHLSYVGDASVGARANIGGGTITCNYDGLQKHRTKVGDDAFVGSNNTLVAPVTVGDGAYTGAGSTITEDVPPESLGIGRARQVNKDGWARERKTKG